MIDGLKKPQQKTKPSLVGAWRSLGAHLVWDQGVEGSNPFSPTINSLINNNSYLIS